MKQNMHFYAAVALLATAATLSSCQQEETMMGRTPADESSAQESLVGTRSDYYPLCTIVTDTLGQVESKLAAYSEETGIPVAALDKISIEGPINQTDIDYLKSLSYVDSLSLEKALFHNASGSQSNTLPTSCFARFKSEAAVVLPDHITTMGPLCFVRSNIRAIYMVKVQVLQETEEKIDVGSNTDIEYYYRTSYYLQDYAGGQFARCTKLKEVKLSGNLSFIPTYMFHLCSALQKIDLPVGLTEIRKGAFASSGLKEVTMNDNLKSLCNESFRGCSSLERVNGNKKLNSIGYYAFGDCSKLKSFTFPESVKELGNCVFYDDENLTEVIWPRMLSTIPKSTFYGCTRLKFTIPDHITSIGDYAFYGCEAITEMTMPLSVESFGDYIFAYSGLTSLVKGMDWIPSNFYRGCAGFRDLIIPDSMRDVHKYAFYECPNLTSVTIRGGVFGESVFYNCDALKEVTIEQCGDIGSSAFHDCDALKKVTIEQCENIGSSAFRDCNALKEVTIEQCENIGNNAFYLCDDLSKVVIKQCGSIGSSAFYYCDALKEVTMEQCSSIGSYAFEYCKILPEITLPEGLVSIGSSAFTGCI